MKKVKINDIEYELVKNYKDGFDESAVSDLITDYYDSYDYILGDWAYGKLRLKGFYNKDNKKVNKINNIEDLDKYIKENCAYDCKYFLLEKEK